MEFVCFYKGAFLCKLAVFSKQVNSKTLSHLETQNSDADIQVELTRWSTDHSQVWPIHEGFHSMKSKMVLCWQKLAFLFSECGHFLLARQEWWLLASSSAAVRQCISPALQQSDNTIYWTLRMGTTVANKDIASYHHEALLWTWGHMQWFHCREAAMQKMFK